MVALAAREVVLTLPSSYCVADLRSAYNQGDLLLQVVIARRTILAFPSAAYFYSINEHFYSLTINASAITVVVALIWIDAEYLLANLTEGPPLPLYFALFVRKGSIFLLLLNQYGLVPGVNQAFSEASLVRGFRVSNPTSVSPDRPCTGQRPKTGSGRV